VLPAKCDSRNRIKQDLTKLMDSFCFSDEDSDL